MTNKYYPKLFEKGRIGNVVIKNRIVRNSMGTYLGNPDGTVTDRQIKAYAEAAEGGAGLIFMDNAVPVPMTSCGLRADKDEFIAGLTLLADALKQHGAVAGMQLAHPGSACQAYSIEIAQTDIRIVTGKRLVAVEEGAIHLADRWGNETTLPTDGVVIAAGFVPQHDLVEQLEQNTNMEVFHVGDSLRVRQIYDAIHEGFFAARQI